MSSARRLQTATRTQLDASGAGPARATAASQPAGTGSVASDAARSAAATRYSQPPAALATSSQSPHRCAAESRASVAALQRGQGHPAPRARCCPTPGNVAPATEQLRSWERPKGCVWEGRVHPPAKGGLTGHVRGTLPHRSLARVDRQEENALGQAGLCSSLRLPTAAGRRRCSPNSRPAPPEACAAAALCASTPAKPPCPSEASPPRPTPSAWPVSCWACMRAAAAGSARDLLVR